MTMLRQRLGADEPTIRRLADELQSTGVAVSIGDGFVAGALVALQQQRLLDAVATHHASAPLSEGSQLREAVTSSRIRVASATTASAVR